MRIVIAAILVSGAATAQAHVGSPDVYAEGRAGAYSLSVVVRPPQVIPGVAEIEVRAATPGIDAITVTPVPLVGEASKHPPVPDSLTRSNTDPQFFTGSLWIMRTGSWQVRFHLRGNQGDGDLSIPLPATALTTRRMQPGMGALLAVLGALLVLGMTGIVAAAAREASVAPGSPIPETNRRKSRIAMAVSFALLVTGIVLGNSWWTSEAADYSSLIYKPLEMTPSLGPGNVLNLALRDPGWLRQRRLDDLIPDHGHLMHLYMIRWPAMDVVFHLHPEQIGSGEFGLALPTVPPGSYRLYADVVHSSGFPETLSATAQIPAVAGRALAGDDAGAIARPLEGSSGSDLSVQKEEFPLPDGYTMVWELPGVLEPKTPISFRFRLLDARGRPPGDMDLYMGMPGHAAFVKADGSVFAHIHPNGTMAMAAFMMANNSAAARSMDMPGMAGMEMTNGSLPNAVTFPYGFPSPGLYRIFVQMKHGHTVETGVFDARVHE